MALMIAARWASWYAPLMPRSVRMPSTRCAALPLVGLFCALTNTAPLLAREFVVATTGVLTSIQHALDLARASDTVTVRAGTYAERLAVSAGGDGTNGPIVLRAYPGERVYINGRNKSDAAAPHLLHIEDRAYVTIIGLRFCSNLATAARGGSGIFIEGAGAHLVIMSNEFYWLRGRHAMGITVFGTASQPISNIVIVGNIIRDCEPATSEALTLNGNVCDFRVCDNLVSNVNNIGIAFIGGERDIHPVHGARNGICSGNRVIAARSSYGGGYAAGIYADGAQSLVIERNCVSGCDMGIEVGAENAGWEATNVTVQSNLIVCNDKIGLIFGGYDAARGRVRHCTFRNNTVFDNNVLGLSDNDFHGEIIVQYAASNRVYNNLFYVGLNGDGCALYAEANAGNTHNMLDYNLYYRGGGGVSFTWHGVQYTSFQAYTNASATGDKHALFTPPELVAPPSDVALTPVSPCIDSGDPSYLPEPGVVDFAGNPRLYGAYVDIGAYELIPEPSLVWCWGAAISLTLLRVRAIIHL
jgi:hypothetical protein